VFIIINNSQWFHLFLSLPVGSLCSLGSVSGAQHPHVSLVCPPQDKNILLLAERLFTLLTFASSRAFGNPFLD
jgi:hypothetical protein